MMAGITKKSLKGFTLFELLVALMVMGVLAGIGIPFIGNFLGEESMSSDYIKMNQIMKKYGQLSTSDSQPILVQFSWDGTDDETTVEVYTEALTDNDRYGTSNCENISTSDNKISTDEELSGNMVLEGHFIISCSSSTAISDNNNDTVSDICFDGRGGAVERTTVYIAKGKSGLTCNNISLEDNRQTIVYTTGYIDDDTSL